MHILIFWGTSISSNAALALATKFFHILFSTMLLSVLGTPLRVFLVGEGQNKTYKILEVMRLVSNLATDDAVLSRRRARSILEGIYPPENTFVMVIKYYVS